MPQGWQYYLVRGQKKTKRYIVSYLIHNDVLQHKIYWIVWGSFRRKNLTSSHKCKSFIKHINFHTRMVARVLMDLNVRKSLGLEATEVLRECSSTLAGSLVKLFYVPYFWGIFRDIYKLALVHPIRKSEVPLCLNLSYFHRLEWL